MPIGDRFDRLVRRARSADRSERRVDLTLGALFALPEWVFLNIGTGDDPLPGAAEFEEEPWLLVFNSSEKADDFTTLAGLRGPKDPLSLFFIPRSEAIPFALRFRQGPCAGIAVNPGADGFQVRFDVLNQYYQQWLEEGAGLQQGFWIPNTTTEEQDFWEDHEGDEAGR